MNWKFWQKVNNEKGNEVVIRPYVFPCTDDNCLVRVACTQPCDKIEMDDDKLMDLFLEHNGCPDCGSGQFHEGPSGGMSTNVNCADCGHGFNLAIPMFVQRIHISGGRFH